MGRYCSDTALAPRSTTLAPAGEVAIGEGCDLDESVEGACRWERRRESSILGGAEKTRPLGEKGVLERHPHDTPEWMSLSPATLFHTTTKQAYWDLYQAMWTFVAAYYEARDRLRAGLEAAFSAGSFPSPLALVPL